VVVTDYEPERFAPLPPPAPLGLRGVCADLASPKMLRKVIDSQSGYRYAVACDHRSKEIQAGFLVSLDSPGPRSLSAQRRRPTIRRPRPSTISADDGRCASRTKTARRLCKRNPSSVREAFPVKLSPR
jgi:hypothetical protein